MARAGETGGGKGRRPNAEVMNVRWRAVTVSPGLSQWATVSHLASRIWHTLPYLGRFADVDHISNDAWEGIMQIIADEQIPQPRATFTDMKKSTAADGYAVDRLTHCLQTAALAERARNINPLPEDCVISYRSLAKSRGL